MAKKITILGGGESGVGAAVLAKEKGYKVFVSDSKAIPAAFKTEMDNLSIPFEENGHSLDRILDSKEVIKSPGIPDKAPVVQAIRQQGIPVIGEMEFAYRYMGKSKLVAVTGSNGKSTATSLIYHICHTAGLDCALVGNIGFSFARQVAVDPKAYYIAEISSFQLDDCKDFRPNIAILLNITEDHLDRYNYVFDNYIASKFSITKNQTADDYFIYCDDDPVTVLNLDKYPFFSKPISFSMKKTERQGAYIKDEEMLLKVKQEEVRMNINDFALKGKHNQYNTMAAGIAASLLEIRSSKIREAITSFQGLEHRMEFVATIKGVEYINDSKATNINSTWYALEEMNKPVVLILGGVDKGNDYSLIEELVQEKVKAIICLGADNTKLHEAFDKTGKSIVDAGSMEEAVKAAYRLSEKGDVVLLSPACASFDLFLNYEDRGKQFKSAVIEL
ncbi:MAG: UDP-N-acetylmuramoyl-L-alanine--D-glutamate ligase [Chitinophagaceae bacterium]|nr:UDP-N-acetylmuramoyl-L-alanine--D-glutamate ligase [Chitinophagaceae bacterium]